MSAYILQDDRMDPGEEYLTYAYRTSHPVLRWLHTKLAEWIGANLCEEPNIPDKQGPSKMLYICPVENVLGRVPLIPCYLNGNSVDTIPHCFRGKIPREAAADSRPNSGTGSRLFEVNMWMWRYGRTFPRQISVESVWIKLWNSA
jgi:hypothetical protein